ISVPEDQAGSRNYYQAHLTEAGGQAVFKSRIDDLAIDHRIVLIKIDAEGHDAEVLMGATGIIDRDRPVVIIETNSDVVSEFFSSRGYRMEKLPGSPNVIHLPD
ncbi:MAG: FkbM family methyltransferase, partial [Gammaproteobacteria bacterium]